MTNAVDCVIIGVSDYAKTFDKHGAADDFAEVFTPQTEDGNVTKQIVWKMCLVILLVLSISSCAKREREDRVVATVGGRPIVVSDIEAFFVIQPAWSPAQIDSAKMEILNRLIGDKVLVLEAGRLGYRDDPAVKEGLESVKKQAIFRQLYQKMVADRATVGEDEVRKYYDLMAKNVKARHILVESKARADSIYARLAIEKGKNFGETVREFSIDEATKTKGGDLGWLSWRQGMLPEDFEDVAFSLQAGEFSRPVKTERGYHIIKVDEIRWVSQKKPYEEEKKWIEPEMKTAKRGKLGRQYPEEVKKRGRIRMEDEGLKVLLGIPSHTAVTREDSEKVVVRSTLGAWTVRKVLEEVRASGRRPTFDSAENAKNYVAARVLDQLLMNEGRRLRLDVSFRTKHELESEVEKRMLRKLSAEVIYPAVQTPSEKDVIGYYNAHKEKYTQPERVKVMFIRFDTREAADDILTRLRRGADFTELMKEVSARGAGEMGGDLGFFTRGMYPEIEEVAFRLKLNEISDVIETRNMFVIIKVTGKERERVQPFEEVKYNVARDAIDEKRNEARQELISKLKRDVKVVIDEQNFKLVGAP